MSANKEQPKRAKIERNIDGLGLVSLKSGVRFGTLRAATEMQAQKKNNAEIREFINSVISEMMLDPKISKERINELPDATIDALIRAIIETDAFLSDTKFDPLISDPRSRLFAAIVAGTSKFLKDFKTNFNFSFIPVLDNVRGMLNLDTSLFGLSSIVKKTEEDIEETVGTLDGKVRTMENSLGSISVQILDLKNKGANEERSIALGKQITELKMDQEEIRLSIIPKLEKATSELGQYQKFVLENADFIRNAITADGIVNNLLRHVESIDIRLNAIETKRRTERNNALALISIFIAIISLILALINFL